MRDQQVTHLRMHRTVEQFTRHKRATANTRAHRDVDRVAKPARGSPTNLRQNGGVDVCVESHRNAQSARQISNDIEIPPSGFRCGRDVAVGRRVH